jgi:hypothetical protein
MTGISTSSDVRFLWRLYCEAHRTAVLFAWQREGRWPGRASAVASTVLGDCAGSPQFTHIAFDDFRVIRDSLAGKGGVTTCRQVPFPVHRPRACPHRPQRG